MSKIHRLNFQIFNLTDKVEKYFTFLHLTKAIQGRKVKQEKEYITRKINIKSQSCGILLSKVGFH